jgi:hypothetical protein
MKSLTVKFVGGRGREPVVVLAVAEERRAGRAPGVDGGTARVHAAQIVPAVASGCVARARETTMRWRPSPVERREKRGAARRPPPHE